MVAARLRSGTESGVQVDSSVALLIRALSLVADLLFLLSALVDGA
jgi:hypothetical protein